MSDKVGYGQYCPLAMSAEFLCQRWTMLILREIFFGSHAFNDISRGVPRMSRTLLSSRLKELAYIGVIERQEKKSSGQVLYKLTKAGQALETVVFSMAEWGQKWLQAEPSVKDVDVGLLMWDIRRNTNMLPELPDPFIVHFYLTDVPENKAHHWLVFENSEVDLCHIDKNFKVDVEIEIGAKKLAKIWMGWDDFENAIKAGEMVIEGSKQYTNIAQNWLGKSSVAHIEKVTRKLQLNYQITSRGH